MKTCIIIGGGIIGMLSARSLLRRGYKVTLLEKGPFGQEASWAGGGILSPLYPWRYPDSVNRLVAASQQLYPELIEQLSASSGIDPERVVSGLLMLDVHDLESAKQWAWKYGVNYELPDAEAIKELEPALVNPSAKNIILPDVAQLRNPRFLKAMQATLQQSGAEMLTRCEVIEIDARNNQVYGVQTKDGRKLESDTIVIANGAWSGRLLQQMQIDLPIHPVRGQMLLLKARPGLIKRMVMQDSRYLIQRSDGQVVVGSTLENVGFDKSTTEQAGVELKAFAAGLVRELANAPVIKHWAGLRPGCGDGIPYIGQHPEIRGLFINAGHFRNGITMAPASAELLAALINDEATEIDPEPYSLHHSRS